MKKIRWDLRIEAMKKIFIILLACLVLALSSCDAKEKQNEDVAKKTSEQESGGTQSKPVQLPKDEF